MSQLNTGLPRARTRLSVITLFGMFVFGVTFVVSASGGGTTSASPSKPANPVSTNEMCGQVVSSPNPSTAWNELLGVAAVSANDVWAVGDYYDSGSSAYQTLVEHWNGSAWSVVPSPQPSAGSNHLFGIAAVSANDVWAVGYYTNYDSGLPGTLVENWNGSAWSVVPSPNPGTFLNFLNAVAAVSANDMWAVGHCRDITSDDQTLVEHWNGSTWLVVPSPGASTYNNELLGVAAVSANDVWAVGYYSNYTSGSLAQTLVEHWNGTEWSIVPSPNPTFYENKLYGVAAVAANDVWAVGYYGNTDIDPHRTLVEHWNGNSWSVVLSPNQGSNANELNAVTAVSANDVWAVGRYDNGVSYRAMYRTLVEHWNGSAWSVVPSPNQDNYYNGLDGVTAVSATDVWAVGDYLIRNDTFETLAERYNPCLGSPTPTPIPAPPTPTPTPTPCTAGQFSDVPPGSTFYPYVTCLVNRGVISGYPDCSFKPNNNVTRGQLAKIVSNAAGFNDNQTTQMFQDVPVGSTFFQYIGRLASRGYMSGYACGGVGEQCVPPTYLPYFRPNNKATRGQLTKIVSNAADFQDSIPISVQTFTDVPPGYAFWVYVERLLLNRPGVMGGYPCGGANEPCDPQSRPYFRPGNNVTRGQTSKIVANTVFPGCQALSARK